MCKNADKPCPGCNKCKKPDAAWMFFTDDERTLLEVLSQTDTPIRPTSHP